MQLNVMLVDKCNLCCKMCRHVQKATGKMMDLKQYREILEQCNDLTIAGSRITSLRLDGGREAILYPQLGDALYETKKQGFGTLLVSNGVLLSKEKSEMLVENGLDYIRISVTGVTPTVYSKFQGYGVKDVEKQFETVYENIRQLVQIRNKKKTGLMITMSYIVTNESVEEADKALFFWRNIGIDEIFFYDDLNDVIIASETGEKIHYRCGGYECAYGVTVAANGDVYPCCSSTGQELVIGNCFEVPLKKVVTSPTYYNLMERVTSLNPELLPEGCKTCAIIAYT